VQKEVADRIVARPGDMSLLALSVQFYAEPRIVRYVGANAFYPPPRVDSAVLRIDLLPKPVLDVPTEDFFRLAAAGFSQPRKQIHNGISQRFWMRPGQAQELLLEVGIDPKRRAETLSLEEWGNLCRVFAREGILKPPDEQGEEPQG
jgi:16S rRNA (adenine1518-N6/adenine1519-N6)-dimethyltransferase